MMYEELYETWKREIESSELERLSPDFYSKVASYLKKLKEESRMLDKRTVKASLLRKELKNVKRMIEDLVQTRCKKLTQEIVQGERVSSDLLTAEEETVYRGVLPFAEVYSGFSKEIISGHVTKLGVEQNRKRAVLRFLKDTPSIIGSDMKSYGPFKSEDVASLPVENAKIMIKQGLAEKVEIT